MIPNVCSYCQQEFTIKNPLTFDHVEPLLRKKDSQGFRINRMGYMSSQKNLELRNQEFDNIIICCKSCNTLKDNFKLNSFETLIKYYRKDYLKFKKTMVNKANSYLTPTLMSNILNSIKVIKKNELNEYPINYFTLNLTI